MGWYITPGASREDVVRERTTSWSSDKVSATCLARFQSGPVLWTAWEIRPKDAPAYRYIGCDLLESVNGSWGYKPMTESMGPYYYSCPPCFFRLVPVPANAAWRLEVKRRQKRLAAGAREEASR